MDIELRDYQQECVNIINSLDSGSYLVAVATGLGKTVIFSHIKRRLMASSPNGSDSVLTLSTSQELTILRTMLQ